MTNAAIRLYAPADALMCAGIFDRAWHSVYAGSPAQEREAFEKMYALDPLRAKQFAALVRAQQGAGLRTIFRGPLRRTLLKE